MLVGFITCDLSRRHGWGHYTVSLMNALQLQGVDMRIITTTDSPIDADMPAAPLLPAIDPAERYLLPKQLLLAPAIGRLLRDCDLIHATIEPFAPVGAWIAAGRPLLVTAHGSYLDLLTHRRWPAGMLYEQAFRRVASIICVSHYTAQVTAGLLPGVRTDVINNGIDPERFANLPRVQVEKQGPTILATGAVKMRKGTLELVRAMVDVRAAIPNVQCVIIGSRDVEPAYTQQVEAEINLHGLQDQVHLLGHVAEDLLLAWYGAADLFVMPSMNVGRKFEGFGLTHLEASAAGLPVIGTRDCGAEDAILHGETGLLVSQEDIDTELPQAIISLLRDPERAARMGAAGQAHAQTQTWDAAARQVVTLYDRCLVDNRR